MKLFCIIQMLIRTIFSLQTIEGKFKSPQKSRIPLVEPPKSKTVEKSHKMDLFFSSLNLIKKSIKN